MAGFSIILLIFMCAVAIPVIAGLILLGYVMDAALIAHVRKSGGKSGHLLGWIPFYGQYLLGKIAGSGVLGLAVAVCHGLIAGTVCMLFSDPVAVELCIFIVGWLVVLAFALKTILAYKLFALADPQMKTVYTVVSVVSLGFAREVMLFCLRNRFPVERIYQKR